MKFKLKQKDTYILVFKIRYSHSQETKVAKNKDITVTSKESSELLAIGKQRIPRNTQRSAYVLPNRKLVRVTNWSHMYNLTLSRSYIFKSYKEEVEDI